MVAVALVCVYGVAPTFLSASWEAFQPPVSRGKNASQPAGWKAGVTSRVNAEYILALKPRCVCFRGRGVAQRRLKDARAVFFQASLRDATAGWILAPWVETHGYRHCLAPRDRIGCSKNLEARAGARAAQRSLTSGPRPHTMPT